MRYSENKELYVALRALVPCGKEFFRRSSRAPGQGGASKELPATEPESGNHRLHAEHSQWVGVIASSLRIARGHQALYKMKQ
jgi:hypothetical protein